MSKKGNKVKFFIVILAIVSFTLITYSKPAKQSQSELHNQLKISQGYVAERNKNCIRLDKGQKLVGVSFERYSGMYIITRNMREDECDESYTLTNKYDKNYVTNSYTIIEMEN